MAKLVQVVKLFNAPVEMVWRIWTEPELIKRWWGPAHYTSPMAQIDFREGGTSMVSMKAPPEMGGQEWFSLWNYIKIVPYEIIEFIQNLANHKGIKSDPSTLGMPADFPQDIRTLVNFRVVDENTTEMTVTEFAEFGSMSHFAQLGLEQSMEKMLKIFK